MQHDINENPLQIMVVEPRGSGGMIHYAYQLCTALSKAGAQVTLVTADKYEMENYQHNFTVRKQMKLWSSTDSAETVKTNNWLGKAAGKIYLGIRRAMRGIRLIVEWIRLTRYLIRASPDIIQFGSIEFPFEAIFLNILKRNRLILSQICHEFELREKSNNPLTNFSIQLSRWVYDAFSIIFFHAESNQRRFLELFDIPEEKLHIIAHGNEGLFLSGKSEKITRVHMQERYGIAEDMPVILFFGNLTPSKGLPDLLKAFSQVHAKKPGARLMIVGRPSKFIDMHELMRLVSDLRISDATIFDARYIMMEEVAPLMEIATVVIYPYLNSTQSGALQVAYTFGRPVIATKVGGLPEAVEDGKSGLLVSASAPDELAEAILKLIKDPGLAAQMGEYAKHLSETKFSWDAIALKMLAVYRAAKV
ncbi:MAG TPA: glycosyltransferase family 4 protein [Anaerolineales bacterium]|nr:glycosyltransferase family 4 protein [Anaerolineales bacterium]